VLLLIKSDSNDRLKIAHEVDSISSFFLKPFDISYFQFRRIFKYEPQIILANNPMFFEMFIEDGFIEPKVLQPLNTRQSHLCFWDETLPETQLFYLKNSLGIFHGLTILNRYKDHYDCASYAMSEPHLSPVANYLLSIKDLQNFAGLFPVKAKHLIHEYAQHAVTRKTILNRESIQNLFFLPKHSVRFQLDIDPNIYITTYEALCVQLVQQGKTYKEIGSILSMEAGSIKTLLSRLKARTGLSLSEVSLHLLHACYAKKEEFNLKRTEHN
jgi:DNA-binding CsgD family transcriptional regulator